MSDLVTRLRTACSPESPLGKLCSEAADAFEVLTAEVERCHERLEIDHWFVLKDGEMVREEIPYAKRIDMIDGIECRDCTISMLEGSHSQAPSPTQLPQEATVSEGDA